jgi:hypothetical protein
MKIESPVKLAYPPQPKPMKPKRKKRLTKDQQKAANDRFHDREHNEASITA